MTFEEFQASKKWSNDLSVDAPDYATYSDDKPACGFVYAGQLVIELVTNAVGKYAQHNGKYELILDRSDYLDYDLPKLEALLYDFAIAERLMD